MLHIRVSAALADALKIHAKTSGTTLNNEVETRLIQTLGDDALGYAQSPASKVLVNYIANGVELVTYNYQGDWAQDTDTVEKVQAFLRSLDITSLL